MKERTNLLYSYNINENKFYTFVHPSAYVAPSVKIRYLEHQYLLTVQYSLMLLFGKHNIIDFCLYDWT